MRGNGLPPMDRLKLKTDRSYRYFRKENAMNQCFQNSEVKMTLNTEVIPSQVQGHNKRHSQICINS